VRPVRIRWKLAHLAAVAIIFLSTTGIASFQALFAPSADLWQRWQAHDPASTATIDHSPWDRLLASYVVRGGDGIARFAYDRVSEADRAALDAYVGGLAATPISGYSRPEQRAYWINLYNALTVQVVLDHYPVGSIMDIDISPGLFAKGPWDKKLLEIEGEPVSLNDIEHRILRPIWQDPRLHYALNCASLGCPDLMQKAYTAALAETLLDTAAFAYVNHPRGVRIDGGELEVSSIYAWFQEDFGGGDKTIIAHLKRYAAPPLAEALASFATIADHDYDWSLNDAATAGL
jgi:hypothetical protein